MRKNYEPQENESHVSRAGSDLLYGLPRILVSEDRVDMTRRIWASTLANGLFVATITGFDECEIVSAKKPFFDYPLFGSFGGIFSIIPVYYAHDCLRKHKMAIFSLLRGRVKILYIFS